MPLSATHIPTAMLVRIAHNLLVDRGLRANQYKNYNVNSFLFTQNTIHLALLCMLAFVAALDGTRGRTAVQQANCIHCKGVYPYNTQN